MSRTSLPSASKNLVGPEILFFCQVPLDRSSVGGDPRLPVADDVGLLAVLVRAIVERREIDQHHDHVLRRDPLAVRRVALVAFDADGAAISIRLPVVAVGDRVRRVGDRDRAPLRSLLERDVRAELPLGLHRPGLCADGRGQLPQVLEVRVQVVRSEALRDAPEVDSVTELVRVVDQLAVAFRGQRRQRLRGAAGVDVNRLPLRGPLEEVQPGAAHWPDILGQRVREDRHVARDAAFGGGLPHDRGRLQAGLRPGGRQVVDHHRNRVALRGLLTDHLPGQRRREQCRGRGWRGGRCRRRAGRGCRRWRRGGRR